MIILCNAYASDALNIVIHCVHFDTFISELLCRSDSVLINGICYGLGYGTHQDYVDGCYNTDSQMLHTLLDGTTTKQVLDELGGYFNPAT